MLSQLENVGIITKCQRSPHLVNFSFLLQRGQTLEPETVQSPSLVMSKIQLDMALSKVLTLPEQGVGPGDPNLNDSVINSILV